MIQASRRRKSIRQNESRLIGEALESRWMLAGDLPLVDIETSPVGLSSNLSNFTEFDDSSSSRQ